MFQLHHVTERLFGIGARSIALIDAAATSPLDQLSMIPLLTLIAIYAPAGHRATWFALMASLMNLALTAGALGTKYLNLIFPVDRGDYANLPALVIAAIVIGLVLPLAAIVVFGAARAVNAVVTRAVTSAPQRTSRSVQPIVRATRCLDGAQLIASIISLGGGRDLPWRACGHEGGVGLVFYVQRFRTPCSQCGHRAAADCVSLGWALRRAALWLADAASPWWCWAAWLFYAGIDPDEASAGPCHVRRASPDDATSAAATPCRHGAASERWWHACLRDGDLAVR